VDTDGQRTVGEVQVVAANVAVQRVLPPEANVTVPVAFPARPASASVEVDPNGTVPGVALAVNGAAAGVTVERGPSPSTTRRSRHRSTWP